MRDKSLSSGVQAAHVSSAQRRGDRDKVEGRVSVGNSDARVCHLIQGDKTMISALFVVKSKGSYSCGDGLCLRINQAGASLVGNNHQEDEGRGSTEKAQVRLSIL